MAEEFRVDVIVDPRKAQRGTQQVDRSLQRVERRAEGLQGTINRALAFTGALLGVRQLRLYADEFTSIQNRLRVVTDTQEELARSTQDLLAISNATRSSLRGTVDLYSRLAIATQEQGIAAERLLNITENVNQAIILSGASGAEAEAGLIQFSQGLASGALRGDELRSVLEQLPVLADIIARELGVTRGRLRELGAEGAITTDVIIRAVENADDRLSEAFGKTVPTLSQSFGVLRNNVVAYVGDADSATGTTRALSRSVLALSENLDAAAVAGLSVGSAFLANRLFDRIATGAAAGAASTLSLSAALQNAELARFEQRFLAIGSAQQSAAGSSRLLARSARGVAVAGRGVLAAFGGVPGVLVGAGTAAVLAAPAIARLADRMRGLTEAQLRQREAGRAFEDSIQTTLDLLAVLDSAERLPVETVEATSRRVVEGLLEAQSALAQAEPFRPLTDDLRAFLAVAGTTGEEIARETLEGIQAELGSSASAAQLADALGDLFVTQAEEARSRARRAGAFEISPTIAAIEAERTLQGRIEDLIRAQDASAATVDLSPLVDEYRAAAVGADELLDVLSRFRAERTENPFERALEDVRSAFDSGDIGARSQAVSDALTLVSRQIERFRSLGERGIVPTAEIREQLRALEGILDETAATLAEREIVFFDLGQLDDDTARAGDVVRLLTPALDELEGVLERLRSKATEAGGGLRGFGEGVAAVDVTPLSESLRVLRERAADAQAELRQSRGEITLFDTAVRELGVEPVIRAIGQAFAGNLAPIALLTRETEELRAALDRLEQDRPADGIDDRLGEVRDTILDRLQQARSQLAAARGDLTEAQRAAQDLLPRTGLTFADAAIAASFSRELNALQSTFRRLDAASEASSFDDLRRAFEAAARSVGDLTAEQEARLALDREGIPVTRERLEVITALVERNRELTAAEEARSRAQQEAQRIEQQINAARQSAADRLAGAFVDPLRQAVRTGDASEIGREFGLQLASATLEAFLFSPLQTEILRFFDTLLDGVNLSGGFRELFGGTSRGGEESEGASPLGQALRPLSEATPESQSSAFLESASALSGSAFLLDQSAVALTNAAQSIATSASSGAGFQALPGSGGAQGSGGGFGSIPVPGLGGIPNPFPAIQGEEPGFGSVPLPGFGGVPIPLPALGSQTAAAGGTGNPLSFLSSLLGGGGAGGTSGGFGSILSALLGAGGSIAGAAGSPLAFLLPLLGGGGGGGAGGLGGILGALFSAKGNVFSRGRVVPFADGAAFGGPGSVIDEPVLFPLGVAGESGDEAIMPLARDARGRLGVRQVSRARRPEAPQTPSIRTEQLQEQIDSLGQSISSLTSSVRRSSRERSASRRQTERQRRREVPQGFIGTLRA